MKKTILHVITILSLVFAFGCSSSKGGGDRFPADIRNTCIAARQYARNCIQSKGIHPLGSSQCSVVKVTGQQKRRGYWTWNYNGLWVGGLCHGKMIEVASDPVTGEVNIHVLSHEFGHHLLMISGYGTAHLKQYGDCFIFWKGADGFAGIKSFSNEEISLDEVSLRAYTESVPEGSDYCLVGKNITIIGFK